MHKRANAGAQARDSVLIYLILTAMDHLLG